MVCAQRFPEQRLNQAIGSHLLYTNLSVPNVGSRPFVLLPLDGDPHTLVLWVSESDEQEAKFIQAAKELAWQILFDAAKKDRRVQRLVLKFD